MIRWKRDGHKRPIESCEALVDGAGEDRMKLIMGALLDKLIERKIVSEQEALDLTFMGHMYEVYNE